MPFKTGLAERRRKVLEKELERLLPKIVELDVEKVILIGSMLGKVHKSSDIDIIVIKKTDKKFLDRLDEFYDHLKPRVAVDILVYTPEEFEKMRRSNQFIRHALKNGRILYEKQRK